QVNPEPISASALLAVLIAAISIYFLYRSIMDGVYWATLLNLSEGGVYASFSPENKASIFATFIEFLAAALLLFNSRKISAWARNFEHAAPAPRTSCSRQVVRRFIVVLLRKSIPQKINLQPAAELNVTFTKKLIITLLVERKSKDPKRNVNEKCF